MGEDPCVRRKTTSKMLNEHQVALMLSEISSVYITIVNNNRSRDRNDVEDRGIITKILCTIAKVKWNPLEILNTVFAFDFYGYFQLPFNVYIAQ